MFILKGSGHADRRQTEGKVYRLRWRCPDTGKLRFVRLTVEQAQTTESRTKAAREQWTILQKRRGELHDGAEKLAGADKPIRETFELYFNGFGARKRKATQDAYRRGVNAFLSWCELPVNNITKCRQVTPSVLSSYASYAAGLTHEGKVRESTTVNNAFRRLSAPLAALARQNKFALTRTQIKESLHSLPAEKVKRPFYRSAVLRSNLEACARHDATPSEGAFDGRMFPTKLFILLTGLRAKEALAIEWRDVGVDEDGHARILVREEVSKTKRERSIFLEHSPLLAHLVSAPEGRTGTVLGGNADALDQARWKIRDEFGATFDCQALRRTCGTFLTCAPSIFGAAAPYMSAAQLGHSVEEAQKSYVGVVKVDSKHRTTEDAMELGIDLATCPKL